MKAAKYTETLVKINDTLLNVANLVDSLQSNSKVKGTKEQAAILQAALNRLREFEGEIKRIS